MFVSKKNLEDDFRSLDEKIDDIQALVTEEIQNNTTVIDNNIKWLNSSITIYRTQLNDLEDRICLLEECETDIPNSNKAIKISEIYDKISINERKVADLRSRFTEYKSTSEDIQDKTMVTLNSMETRMKHIEDSTQSLIEIIEHHKNQNQDLDVYNQELTNLNSKMTNQVSNLKNQIKECNQKILVQNDSISRLQEVIKTIYKELTAIKENNKPLTNIEKNITPPPLQQSTTTTYTPPKTQSQQPKTEKKNNENPTNVKKSNQVYDKHSDKVTEKKADTQHKKEVKENDNVLKKEADIQPDTKLSVREATEKFIISEIPSRIIFGKNETMESIQRKVQELSNLDSMIKCTDIFDNSSKNRYLKCIDTYKNRLIKNMLELDLKNIAPENISAVVSENFFKIISANIIDVFIPLLYTIIKNGRGENRESHFLLLKEINIYLEKCCIYTKNISFDDIPNQRVFEMMNVSRTFTRNATLAQHISEIKSLPYCMNYIGTDGKKAVLLKKGIMSVYKG